MTAPSDAPRARAAAALREALAAVAPEADLDGLAPDRPLRDQIDLDSLDWVNVWADAQQRLGIEDPAWPSAPATLDGLVAALAGAAASRATPPPPPSSATEGRAQDGTADRSAEGPVVLRPLRPDDVPLEADHVRRMSEESRHARYMGTLRELPPGKLAFLGQVDQSHQVALGALVRGPGASAPERLVGVARYVVDAGGRGCEFAVSVDDALQGSGLAGRLMHALIARARAAGLARMEGLILAANRPMLRFARQLGFRLAPVADDPHTVQAVLDL